MTQFHPDTTLLSEYAAGSLPESQALCVAAHLEHCAHCRTELHNLMQTATALLDHQVENEQKPNVSDALFDKVLANIEHQPNQQQPDPHAIDGNDSTTNALPAAVQKLLPSNYGALKWVNLGSSLSVAKLPRLEKHREIALHKLQPGSSVTEHDHKGQEITVVLCGSFSDANGQYFPGDFLVRQPGETHRPTATIDQECICLSVTDAPVKFTGWLSRLLNPLVAYHHRH